jgi:hypothetical protein
MKRMARRDAQSLVGDEPSTAHAVESAPEFASSTLYVKAVRATERTPDADVILLRVPAGLNLMMDSPLR